MHPKQVAKQTSNIHNFETVHPMKSYIQNMFIFVCITPCINLKNKKYILQHAELLAFLLLENSEKKKKLEHPICTNSRIYTYFQDYCIKPAQLMKEKVKLRSSLLGREK